MGIYSFGPFRLEVEERRLLREGQAIQLRGKIFDTLCVLVANRGRLMRKDELLETIWPNSAVEENSLDQNISHLRKALADGKNLKYIETVPRQGYRFVAEVAEQDRKSTRLNSSHSSISYAVFCLKKKNGADSRTHGCTRARHGQGHGDAAPRQLAGTVGCVGDVGEALVVDADRSDKQRGVRGARR